MNFVPPHSAVSPAHRLDGTGNRCSTKIYPQFEEEFCTPEYLDAVLEHRFGFNGEMHRLGHPIDWLTNPSTDIEWHILLHKFYFAVGLAREYHQTNILLYPACFRHLVESWIEQTEPGFIATDVTGRRVQNWIYAWHLFHENSCAPFDEKFKKLFFDSIVAQVSYILSHLAPVRNHRTLELYAVFLTAIALPELEESDAWRETAVSEMIRNIRTDLLPDGVHCELASDYHHIVLRSYLLFYRLAKANHITLPPDVGQAVCRALEFSQYLHRPDGFIPALSDSDSKSYLYLLGWGAELFGRDDFAFVASQGKEGRPPAATNRNFPDSGYIILRSAWEPDSFFREARHLVFDCGPIGAGNHGHLDALSVEISAYGRALIVDPGRYSYDEQQSPNWRARFRETAAHNTVTVDSLDQAIYQQNGLKKNIHKPHPVTTLVKADLVTHIPFLHGRIDSPNYEAGHDRRIWFPRSQYWLLIDSLSATEAHRYDQRFQLTPAAEGAVEIIEQDGVTEILSPGMKMICVATRARVCVERSFVSVEYGIKQSAPRIHVHKNGTSRDFVTFIVPFRDHPPDVVVNQNKDCVAISISSGPHLDVWKWRADSRTISLSLPHWRQTWSCAESGCATS